MKRERVERGKCVAGIGDAGVVVGIGDPELFGALCRGGGRGETIGLTYNCGIGDPSYTDRTGDLTFISTSI